jgi:hypothetical protein
LSPLNAPRGTTEFTLLRESTPTRTFAGVSRYMVFLAMETYFPDQNESVFESCPS